MMFPSVFGENLFDDWMDDFGFRDNFFSGKNPLYGKHAKNIMKTDVRETDKGYELDVDLPGFKKDEVQVQLKDGYLTISAAKGLDKDEEDKKGNYIRRERYAGSTSRDFLFRRKQLKRSKLINMYLLKADIDSLSQEEDP